MKKLLKLSYVEQQNQVAGFFFTILALPFHHLHFQSLHFQHKEKEEAFEALICCMAKPGCWIFPFFAVAPPLELDHLHFLLITRVQKLFLAGNISSSTATHLHWTNSLFSTTTFNSLAGFHQIIHPQQYIQKPYKEEKNFPSLCKLKSKTNLGKSGSLLVILLHLSPFLSHCA